jgi:hypothetical protein
MCLLVKNEVHCKIDTRLSRELCSGLIEPSVTTNFGKNSSLKLASLYAHPLAAHAEVTDAASKAPEFSIVLSCDFNDNGVTRCRPGEPNFFGRPIDSWYNVALNLDLFPIFLSSVSFQGSYGDVTHSSTIDGCFDPVGTPAPISPAQICYNVSRLITVCCSTPEKVGEIVEVFITGFYKKCERRLPGEDTFYNLKPLP